MTNNTDPVRALPDQWRDAAEFFKGDAGSDIRETLMACARELEAALAQQPAAVDRARFRKAPCYLCGYNGAGYFQPETHPCAALYHAAQQQGGAK